MGATKQYIQIAALTPSRRNLIQSYSLLRDAIQQRWNSQRDSLTKHDDTAAQ